MNTSTEFVNTSTEIVYKLEKDTQNGWMCYETYIDRRSAVLAYADKKRSNPKENFRVIKETREFLNVS